MFYVRTAACKAHQHLANNLERRPRLPQGRGMNDSLGPAELEAQMQHVDTTSANGRPPSPTRTCKRFRTFVNSDKADEHIVSWRKGYRSGPARPERRAADSAELAGNCLEEPAMSIVT